MPEVQPRYLRLRQICLAAPALEPAVAAMRAIFGLEVCHRDPAVAKYGLVNALFVVGHAFVEIVAPLHEGSAAGRFIERSGGVGGYMAIFDCHDPEWRRERALAMGIRIAHELAAPGFWGSQLHPADCRATMLEFDRSRGGEALSGAYWPAGPHWQAQQRLDRVSAMPWAEVRSADAEGLAAFWSRLFDWPLSRDDAGRPQLRFDLGALRFATAPRGAPERLATLALAVPDPQAVLDAAARHGCEVDGAAFRLAGMRLQPVPAA